ncbi:ABC transporter permease [Puniceicoccaceae bacterium K14]|nr:ABC transporter permease [Puniceicoccaceae bacterium K14]
MKVIQARSIRKVLDHSTLILFAAIVITFGFLSSQFFTFQNLSNILIQSSSLAIIATGMTFVLLTAGIDLSVGSTMFLAGVVSAKMVAWGSPLWLACVTVLLVGTLYGLVNAFFIYRFKIIPFIVTLATFYVGRGFGLFLSETRAMNLPEGFLKIGSVSILGIPFPVLVLGVVILSAHLALSKTQFGRQIYAVGNNAEKARKAGMPVDRILLSVYLICGFCAALGGLVAIAQLGAVSPTFGKQSEFMAIAAAILGGTSLFGGKGNVFPGTLIGAVTIQSIQNGLVIVNANPYLYPLITGAVIFLIVLIDSLRHMQEVKSRRLGASF